MILTTTIGILLTIASVPAFAQIAPAVGSISGTVIDDAGRPVPGAKLVYAKLTEHTRDQDGHQMVKDPGFAKAITAGQDGSFAFSGLPPGRYHVCAYGTQPTQVGSCDWGGVPVITLRADQSIQNVTRRIYEGAVVSIRVADPNGSIAVPDSKGRVARERRFFIGLSSQSGFYRPAARVSQSATDHVFRIIIPRQMVARLFIDSELSVTEASGVPLETRRPTTWQIVPAGREQLTVNLNVR